MAAQILNRITSLFSRRAFNIDSLAVGVTDDPSLSRITIIVDNGNSVVEQVEKQLNKLIEVIKVRTLDESTLIGRELMLIKVSANKGTREQIMTICGICGAKVADISPTSMTMELSDTSERVNTFEDMIPPSKSPCWRICSPPTASWRWPAPACWPCKRVRERSEP